MDLQTMDVPFEKIPAHLSAMAVMGAAGDTKYIWDKTKPDEVEIAKATFESFMAKKYLAFKVVGKDGTQGEPVKTFDPNEERYIFIPQMQGG